jgi:putative ABC transport system permease protein
MIFLTELKEGLWIAWGALCAHKLRSTLTTLGIVIGVATVTLMGTVIDGLDANFRKSISFLGADTLYASRSAWINDSEEDWIKGRRRQPITFQQARMVAAEMKTARAVALVAEGRAPVFYRERKSDSVSVFGVTDQYLKTAGFTVEQGRFLSQEECEGGRPVCVIGQLVASNLFQHEPALGNRIRAGNQVLDVVGVLEKQGGLMGMSLDDQILVPLLRFVDSFDRQPDIEIQVKAGGMETIEDTREELRGLLRRARHVPPGASDDFSINTQDAIMKTFHRVVGTIAGIGLFVTGLSLFVGGIGIMNIMFVSVAERTREIGIRKALGAKKRAILVQFLTEAACLCLLGGLIALGIAWPVTLLMQSFMPATLSPLVVSIAILVSLLTGLVSGFLPAWRAARMNPVDALRSE